MEIGPQLAQFPAGSGLRKCRKALSAGNDHGVGAFFRKGKRPIVNMRIIASIAVLFTLTGAAWAQDWRFLANVYLWPQAEIYSQRVDLPGPVQALMVRAQGGTAHCLTVRANFRDDETRIIHRGDIAEGVPLRLSLEGGDTSIRRLWFRCSGPESVSLVVTADAGRFAQEWATNSTLSQTWGTLHNWGSVLANRWTYVGEARFQSRYGEDEVIAPQGAVTAVALMPMRIDARCRSGEALLRNGRSLKLALDRETFLAHDQYNKVELPPSAHDLEALRLDCRATNGSAVRMRIYGAS
jgi:hypothetical protein